MLGDSGEITAINSSAFTTDTTGWMEIAEGAGDRYHHAQNHYLPGPVTDKYGRFNYRFVDGEIVEIPTEEKPPIPSPTPSAQDDLLSMTVDHEYRLTLLELGDINHAV
jgi:hypothetical protein